MPHHINPDATPRLPHISHSTPVTTLSGIDRNLPIRVVQHNNSAPYILTGGEASGLLGRQEFETFFSRAEPGLRYALVGAFGPELGREAAADALAYGWEHWRRVSKMDNPAGYLYRVGYRRAKRAARKQSKPLRNDAVSATLHPEFEPGLEPAMTELTERQRQVVYLVAAADLGIRGTARVLGLSPGAVQNHYQRGLEHLRAELGVTDV